MNDSVPYSANNMSKKLLFLLVFGPVYDVAKRGKNTHDKNNDSSLREKADRRRRQLSSNQPTNTQHTTHNNTRIIGEGDDKKEDTVMHTRLYGTCR